MASDNGQWIEKVAVIIGLISSGMYIHSHWNTPPVPKCPQCHLPQSYPSERFSACPRCGQIMDWKIRVGGK